MAREASSRRSASASPAPSFPPPTAADRAMTPSSSTRVVTQLEHRQERLLRDLDTADLLHALLAFLLALEQLALAGDVAAVALGGDVLPVGLDGLAGDDVRADRGLDRHVVLLARDLLAQLLGQRLADLVGLVAVDDHRQ